MRLLRAWAALDEAEIIILDVFPIRQRSFVDIEYDGGPFDLVGAALHVGKGIGDHQREVVAIGGHLIRQQLFLVFVDVDRRLFGGRNPRFA